jgi:hypothetical protein
MAVERTRAENRSGRVSIRQLKAIWSLARRAGIDGEELHLLTHYISRKDSIRCLNKEEANRIIEELILKGEGRMMVSQDATFEKGGCTKAQLVYIGDLSRQMGWTDRSLLGFAQKMYGVQDLADLRRKQASGLIEALKAMKLRHAA